MLCTGSIESAQSYIMYYAMRCIVRSRVVRQFFFIYLNLSYDRNVFEKCNIMSKEKDV